MSFEFARQQPDKLPAADWKKELRQKLAQAQERKGRASVARSTEPIPAPLGTTLPPPKSPEIKRTAVDPQPISKAGYDIHKNLLDFQASIQKSPSEKNENPAAGAARKPSVQRDLPKSLNATRASSVAAHVPTNSRPRIDAGSLPQSWIAGKGILLTRTLSGLIDLLIVAGCTVLFLGISLRFGNIDIMAASFRPTLWGSVLFFQLFYSIYFLGLTHRTVGMMLTGLKVIDEQADDLLFYQLLLRCVFFLFSWALAMFGLMWALWDRRSRCLHDFLSRTAVIRC
ncbi:MAG TPA: RDD family protein [Acidobacteriota bacterium]